MDAGTPCWTDIDGPVHYVDFGGPPQAPSMVLVHGLGGSYANWLAIGPLLARRFRVTAVDLAGFGLTPAAGRATTVTANGTLVSRFVREVLGEPAVWVGNSMGGLLALVQVGAHPDLARGVVLIDQAWLPSLRHRPRPVVSAAFATYFVPGLSRAVVAARRRLRTPEQTAHDTLALCCADASRIPPAVLAEHVKVLEARSDVPGLAGQFETAARSLVRTLARRRELEAWARRLAVPVLVIHGDRDPLVPVRTATALAAAHPRWSLAVAPGAGHLPMLEVPEWTAASVASWWQQVDLAR